jgi:hypothetical protein
MAQLVVEESTTIRAAPDAVWAFLVLTANFSLWRSNVSDPEGVTLSPGGKFRFGFRAGPLTLPAAEEVIGFALERFISLRQTLEQAPEISQAAPMDLTTTLLLEPYWNDTRLTYRQGFDLHGLARFVARFGLGRTRKQLAGDLARLKEAIET